MRESAYSIIKSTAFTLIAILSFVVIIITLGCGMCTKQCCCSRYGFAKECREQKEQLDACKKELTDKIEEVEDLEDKKSLWEEQRDILMKKLKEVYEKEQAGIIENDCLKKLKENEKLLDSNKLHVTTDKGDCLSYISLIVYKDMKLWPFIWWENKEQINNPDLIYPGQVFYIRDKDKFTKDQEKEAIQLHNKRYKKKK